MGMGTHGKMESKVKSESMYASVFLTNIKLGIKREREGESSLNLRSRKLPKRTYAKWRRRRGVRSCEMQEESLLVLSANFGAVSPCASSIFRPLSIRPDKV